MEQLLALILSAALLVAVVWWAIKIYRAVICVPKILKVLEDIRDQGYRGGVVNSAEPTNQVVQSVAPVVDQVDQWSDQQERNARFPG